jgi:predicted tellurium resistance membrane protein TerC
LLRPFFFFCQPIPHNLPLNTSSRFITVSDAYDGTRFFTTGADGARVATPLLLVLAVIELSDIVFAVDSVPAVFGVSQDPAVVWGASMAAIASLRSLYGFVSTALGDLAYLDKAVAVVLGWVGTKMVYEFVSGDEVSTGVSLGVVAAALAVGVGVSLAFPKQKD